MDKNEKNKKQKGITLISLIVTIIVLLILAGVPIIALTGESGIIIKATKQRGAVDQAKFQEELDIELSEFVLKKRTTDIDMDEFVEELEDKGIVKKATKKEDGSYDVETDQGYDTEIKPDPKNPGNVVADVEGKREELPPKITSFHLSSTTSTIGIKITSNDRGLPTTYKYYYGTDKEDYNLIEETEELSSKKEELIQNVKYYVKVEATNRNGTDVEEGEILTESIPDASKEKGITFKDLEWKGGKATLPLEKKVENSFDIQYRNGEQDTWHILENGKIPNLELGDQIEVRYWDGTNYGPSARTTIAEEKAPEITLETETTTNSLKVDVEVTDKESGLNETIAFNYYLKEHSKAEYDANPTITRKIARKDINNGADSYTFTKLTQTKEYDVKVEIVDRANNKGTKTTTNTTETMPEGNSEEGIAFTSIVWNSTTHEASVNASKKNTNTDYTIRYGINSEPNNTTFTDLQKGGPISGLHLNDVVYAELWDGTNYGKPATITIDEDKPPIVTLTKGEIDTSNITVNVTAKDNEAGLPDEVEYKYYIKLRNAPDEDYQLKKTNKVNNAEKTSGGGTATKDTYTFQELKQNTTYQIKVEVADKAKNTTTKATYAKTEKIPGTTGSTTQGKDTDEDGKVDAWDTDGDGKIDSWDTDGDGNADSFDKNGNGILDDDENASNHPEENNNGRDKNGGKDTNGDGVVDTWDTDGDGEDDAKDTDGDGCADEWKNPETGEWEKGDTQNPKPEDTDGDGKPDLWTDPKTGEDKAQDTNGDGKADKWFDPNENEWKDTDEEGHKQWDTDGDGEPDAKDTNGDGNADQWKDPETGGWSDGSDKNPRPKDTNQDGMPDTWTDPKTGKDVAKDTDVPPDGKADQFKDPNEDNWKDPEENNGGKDTDGDGKIDSWDTDKDGNIDAKDTDGDGNADTWKDPETGEWKDSKDQNPKPKDTDGDGIPDTWVDENEKEVGKDTNGDGKADQWKDPDAPDSGWKNEDENNHKQWDTDGDGEPDAKDTDGDQKADTWKDPETGEWKSGKDQNPKPQDTDGDGLPDKWVDENGNEVSKDTSEPKDGKADEFKPEGGEYPPADKYPKGKDLDGDGLPDVWVDEDGNIVAKDTSEPKDGKADEFVDPKTGKFPGEGGTEQPNPKPKDTNGDGIPDEWEDENGKIVGKDTNGDGKADQFVDPETQNPGGGLTDKDKDGDKLLDTDGDGKPDAKVDPSTGEVKEWKDPDTGEWKTPEEIEGKPKDTDKDGKPDQWDFNNDGKIDAWDTDGDGKPDKWDTNGDGKVDAWDTDGDGEPDSYDTNKDGSADNWVLPAEEGSIEFSYNPPDWTNGKVVVTLTSKYTENGFTIQYSTDYDHLTRQGTWKDGTTATFTDNGTIYARLKAPNGETGGLLTGKVNKIDKVAPIININKTKATTSTITVKTDVEDRAAGLPETIEYKYYVKKKTDPNYQSTPTKIERVARGEDKKTSTNTCTFETLQQTTDYDIKVTVEDAVTNMGEKATQIKTETVPVGEGNILLNNLVWNSTEHKATVTVSTQQTGYKIRYWTTYDDTHKEIENNGTITVTKNNTTIYAELWDETNAGAKAASITIIDNAGPVITDPKVETTTKEITVTTNATDAQFGMPETPEYKFYIKKSGDTAYPVNPAGTSSNGTFKFENKEQSILYNIKIEVADYMKNVSTKETTGTTKTMPDANSTDSGLDFGAEKWSNRKATVTVTKKKTNDGYKIQYKIGDAADAQWIEIADGGTVPQQSHGTKVYARLWDGVNGGTPKLKTITDATKPTVDTAQQETNDWKNVNKKINVTATDNQSGIAAYAITTENKAPAANSDAWKTEKNGSWTSDIAYDEGTYYAWVKDEAGNISAQGKEVVVNNIDKANPTISVDNDSVAAKSQVGTITLTDAKAGLKAGKYTIKYTWTKDSTEPNWTSINTTLSIDAANGDKNKQVTTTKDSVTGTWYLHARVENLTDWAGNQCTVSDKGEFQIDNQGPSITFVTDGNAKWAKKQSSVVQVVDNNEDTGRAGVKNESLKYVWKQQNTGIQEAGITEGFTNNTAIEKSTDSGNNWYLWVIAKDSLDNTTIKCSKVFWLDNTPPNDEKPTLKATTNTITVTSKQTDSHSGIKASTRQYSYKKKTDKDWSAWETDENNVHTFNKMTLNTEYEVRTQIKDTLDNGYRISQTETITTSNIEMPLITAAPTTPTNGKVTITINYPEVEGTVTKQYREGETGQWKPYTAPFQISENKVIYARQIDSDEQGSDNSRVASLEITNIDTQKPTITKAEVSSDWSKESKTVKVTAKDDGTAGIAGYTITDSTTKPAETAFTPSTATTWTSPAKGNGTWYVWVIDAAKNISDPYKVVIENIENNNPKIEVNSNTDVKQSHTATVKISDSDSGLAAKSYTIKYTWLQSANPPSDWSTIKETKTITVSTNGTKEATVNITQGEFTGTYYLHVQVTDLQDWAGNKVTAVAKGQFVFDNTKPTISFSPNTGTYQKSWTTKVTVSDSGPATLNTTTMKYVWTQTTTEPTADKFTNTLDSASKDITLSGENGTWYLWVKAQDSIGNEKVQSSGAFNLDNTPPSVTFNPEKSTDWKQVQSSTVSVTDTGVKTLGTLKYLWNTNGTTKPADSAFSSTFSAGGKIESPNTLTGNNYYLWVMVQDSLGNSEKYSKGPFYIDNTDPTDTKPTLIATTNSITATFKQTDSNSGINNSTRQYAYRAKTTPESAWSEWQNGETNGTKTFTGLKLNTVYQVKTQVKDTAGNGYKESQVAETTTVNITKPKMTATPPPEQGWTNKDVTVTIVFPEIVGTKKQYGFGSSMTDLITWEDTTETTFKISIDSSKTIYARCIDDTDQGSDNDRVASLSITYIDKSRPLIDTVTAPEDWSKTKKAITVKAAQEYGYCSPIVGYAITESNSEPALDSNVWKESSEQWTWTSEAIYENKTYYAWIKDKAGNISYSSSITVSKVDIEGPTVQTASASTDWSNDDKTITATASDNAGGIGIAAYAITTTDSKPAANSADWVPSTDTSWTSIKKYSAATYYVWAKDGLNNISTKSKSVAVTNIDKESPQISVNSSTTAALTAKATVTLKDTGGAGFAKGDYTFKYQWSTAETAPTDWSKVTTKSTITIGTEGGTTGSSAEITSTEKVTGNYYLHVQPQDIKDRANNACNATAKGSFVLDNEAPTVTFTPNENSNWKTTQETLVNVTDNVGGIGVEDSSLKYDWYTSQVAPTEGMITTEFSNGQKIIKDSGAGIYYLYIVAKDKLGNSTMVRSKSFYVDNVPPTVAEPTLGATTNSITLTFNQTDDHSGIDKKTREYTYKLSTATGWEPWKSIAENETKATINGLELNKDYDVKTRVKDIVGNPTTGPQESQVATVHTQDITKPIIKISNENITNQTITATINYPTTGLTNQYKIDNGAWTNYPTSGGVPIEQNCTISAQTIDSDGQGSDATRVATLQVTNIDKQKPTVLTATASDEWSATNKTITVTAEDQGVGEILAYAITDTNEQPAATSTLWKINTSGTWTSRDTYAAGNYWAWVKDGAGNISETGKEVTVGKIDTTAPTVTLDKNEGAWAQSHTVTVKIQDEESGIKTGAKIQYAWSTDGTTQPAKWTDATVPSYTNGQTTEIKVSLTRTDVTEKDYLWIKPSVTNVANTANTTVIHSSGTFNVDTTPPTLTFEQPEENTIPKKSIDEKITIKFQDKDSGLAPNGSEGAIWWEWWWYGGLTIENQTAKYSIVNGRTELQTITRGIGSSTGKWKFKFSMTLVDVAGNKKRYEFTSNTFYIDATPPEITSASSDSNSITFSARDEDSNIVGYAVTTSDTVPDESSFIEVPEAKKLDSQKVTGLNPSTTYYIWVKDQAGNINSAYPFDTGLGIMNADDLAGDNLKNYQGAYVDLGQDICGDANSTTDDWRLFYVGDESGENRIFLIAADCVPVTKLQDLGIIGGTSILGKLGDAGLSPYATDGTNPYSVCWKTGPSWVDLPTSLNQSLIMHKGYSLTSNNAKNNSKAVSQLLNTDVWKPIKDNATEKSKIDFVIGGSTLEMWCAAWNKNMPETGTNEDGLVKITANTTNDYGYYVSSESIKDETSLDMRGTKGTLSSSYWNMLFEKYSTFFSHSYDSGGPITGYRLASPSAFAEQTVYKVDLAGRLSSTNNANACCVRPVVCLSSGVKLVQDEEKSTADKIIYNVEYEQITSDTVTKNVDGFQGAYVDLGQDICGDESSTTDDWRIFYAGDESGENRMFLIAADYVPATKLQSLGIVGTGTILGNLGYAGLNSHDSIDLYPYGVRWQQEPSWMNLPSSLSLDLIMHTGYSLTDNNTTPNSKAVSQLLNTDVWKPIKEKATEKSKIDFVIGGSTVEMWCAAWNKNMPETGTNEDGFMKITANPTGSYGYYLSSELASKKIYLYMDGTMNQLSDIAKDTLKEKYSTFFKRTSEDSRCRGYMLASPSAYNKECFIDVSYIGAVSFEYYININDGVRPVVCLNSNVQLIKDNSKSDSSKTVYNLDEGPLPPNYSITRDGETQNYTYLSEAYTAAVDGDTINVLKDTLPETNSISFTKNLTINIGDYVITNNGATWNVDAGTLTLQNGKVVSTGNTPCFTATDGSLTITQTAFESQMEATPCISATGSGTVNIRGSGTNKPGFTAKGTCLDLSGGSGTTTINSANIVSTNGSKAVFEGGSRSMTMGITKIVAETGDGLEIDCDGRQNILSASVEITANNGAAVHLGEKLGSTWIMMGTIKGDYGIYCDSSSGGQISIGQSTTGTSPINMLTVMGEQYGIYAPNCRVLMYGGTLAGKTNAYNVLNISIPTTSSQNWKLSEYTSNGYYYAQVVKQ